MARIPEFGVESQFLVIWDLKSSDAKLSDVKLLKTQNCAVFRQKLLVLIGQLLEILLRVD